MFRFCGIFFAAMLLVSCVDAPDGSGLQCLGKLVEDVVDAPDAVLPGHGALDHVLPELEQAVDAGEQVALGDGSVGAELYHHVGSVVVLGCRLLSVDSHGWSCFCRGKVSVSRPKKNFIC